MWFGMFVGFLGGGGVRVMVSADSLCLFPVSGLGSHFFVLRFFLVFFWCFFFEKGRGRDTDEVVGCVPESETPLLAEEALWRRSVEEEDDEGGYE